MSYRIGKNFWLSNKRFIELALECEEYLIRKIDYRGRKLEKSYKILNEIHKDWFSEMTKDEFYAKYVKPAENNEKGYDDFSKMFGIEELEEALDEVNYQYQERGRNEYDLEKTSRAYLKALLGEKPEAFEMQPTFDYSKKKGTLYAKAS